MEQLLKVLGLATGCVLLKYLGVWNWFICLIAITCVIDIFDM